MLCSQLFSTGHKWHRMRVKIKTTAKEEKAVSLLRPATDLANDNHAVTERLGNEKIGHQLPRLLTCKPELI